MNKSKFIREEVETKLGNIKVADFPIQKVRIMFIDDTAHSVVDLNTLEPTSDYNNSFELMSFYHSDPKTALVIGLGAGNITKRLEEQEIITDTVDINPDTLSLAKQWFNFTPKGEVYISDGLDFLSETKKNYDLIILDVFSAKGHPKHLYTSKAFELMKDRLNPGGIVGVNILSHAYGTKNFWKIYTQTILGEVFSSVKALSSNRYLNPTTDYLNISFFASDTHLKFNPKSLVGQDRLVEYYERIKEKFLETKD